MSDLISVMVPVYNAEKHLSKCIESLMLQTYENIQIVLVNDGSKDASLEVCHRYAEKDCRIKVVDQENGGEGAARNRGLYEADGLYICFVDADDYIKPDFVKNLYELQKTNEAQLSICGFVEMKESQIINETAGNVEIMTQAEAMENLLKHTSFKGYVWNKMYDMNIIRKNNIQFDKSLAVWTDVLFVFTYMKHIKKAVYDPKPMYYYIFWESSVSHQKNHLIGVEKAYSAIRAKDQIVKLIPHDYDKVRRQIDIRYVQSALAVLRNIGYMNYDKNNQFYKRSINILKQQGKRISPCLSKKEQLLLKVININPSILLFLYKIKSKIG